VLWYDSPLAHLPCPVIYRFFVYTSLLLCFVSVVDAGRYQRTKDRQIRVWNEHPERWDEAIWTGDRDDNGYAIGSGVLTWYRLAHSSETGSLIPSTRGHELIPVASFSGSMSEGHFDGLVMTTDGTGKKFHATFADGSRTTPWTAGAGTSEPGASPSQKIEVAAKSSPPPEPPAEGPVVHRSAVVEAPTQDSNTLEVFRPPSSLRASYSAPDKDQSSPPAQATKEPPHPELTQQVQFVLTEVGRATKDFRDIERLDSVQPLPEPIASNIRSLADRARSIRSKNADDPAIRSQVETLDALSLLNETTTNLAAKNPATVSSKLNQFLKNHPAPPADSQRSLWHYLSSAQALCDRNQKEANVHLQRAQILLTAASQTRRFWNTNKLINFFPAPPWTAKSGSSLPNPARSATPIGKSRSYRHVREQRRHRIDFGAKSDICFHCRIGVSQFSRIGGVIDQLDNSDAITPGRIGNWSDSDGMPVFQIVGPVTNVRLHDRSFFGCHRLRKIRPRRNQFIKIIFHSTQPIYSDGSNFFSIVTFLVLSSTVAVKYLPTCGDPSADF